ncbi:MAG: hypothetical protein K0S20_450 [Patescibacteria group bacterium]|jgi:hypothetical protein|nr:hypothetical protein [Patescibacteria group bacterium]
MEPTYRIVSGPSKFDLMLALFHSTYSHSHYVEFEVALPSGCSPSKWEVRVQSIEREDGSGDSWNIVVDIISITSTGVKMPSASLHKDYRSYKGYYSTKNRSGNFSVRRD